MKLSNNQHGKYSLVKTLIRAALLVASLVLPVVANSQAPVTPNSNHDQLLISSDPKAAANKRLVYDFWREVFEGGQMQFADKYLTESYIQHNPSVPSGRVAFVEFFQRFRKPTTIEQRVKAPLVANVAEGDLVVLSFVREYDDPKDATKKYTTTWFDMFRIENGKIAEHWDPALKR